MRICVVSFGVQIDLKNCTCEGLASHIHMTRAKAKHLISRGYIRQIHGNVFQRTRRANERVQWISRRSGCYGPIVLQMTQ